MVKPDVKALSRAQLRVLEEHRNPRAVHSRDRLVAHILVMRGLLERDPSASSIAGCTEAGQEAIRLAKKARLREPVADSLEAAIVRGLLRGFGLGSRAGGRGKESGNG